MNKWFLFQHKLLWYPCIDFVAVKDVSGITKRICNINNAKQDLVEHPLWMTGSDRDYILEEL